MPPTEIRLLGGFQMTHRGEPVTDLSGRLQALLARLLLQPNIPCSRQQIAFALWPESTDSQSRTNLRRLLFLLRRALPTIDDLVEISRDGVAWHPRIAVDVDLLAFESSLATAPGTSRRAALEAAVELYAGDLLPDCYDEWILPQRERLRNALAHALDELVLLAEGERDYPAAIVYARRLLRHDPLHEASYWRLMRLLALTGDRAGALQIYHTCATLLYRELGVEPGPDLQELYDQLLGQQGSLRAAPPPETPLSPLVGRMAEWQALQKAWQASSRGAPGWVLITGEAGMGKSRLAEEMLAWAERQAIPAAYARSYASAGQVGYGPIVDLLRSDALRPGWEKLDKHWLIELSRLLPEIHTVYPHLPPPPPLAEEWQKRRLLEALAQSLMGDGRPRLLVLDDLQWADRESLEFLAFLLRFRPQARLLLVGTARSEEILDNHTLQTVMQESATHNQLIQLPLAPLTSGETGQLATQTGSASLDEAAVRALHGASGGNPLFVVEMTRAGDWGAGIGDLGSGRYMAVPVPDPKSPVTSHLPPKLQAVIEFRLARLSAPAREIVAQAATLGRSFTYPVLAAACGLDEAGLVDGLDELWRRRVIREVGGDGYDFSHDRIRDVAYRMISHARRRLLHRRAGEALLHVHAGKLGPVQGQLGYHFASAGETLVAIGHYRQAAAVALERYAHAEASESLTCAINLAGEMGDTAVYPLLAERERINRSARRMDEGSADLALLAPLVERLNDGSPEANRRTALLTLSRHYYASWLRDSNLALRLAQESVDLAQSCGDQAIETDALLRCGQELFGQGRFDAAAPVLADGYAKAMAAGLPTLAALSLERQASIYIVEGGNQARIEDLLLESLRLHREAGSESRISDILNKLGYAILVQGSGEYARALSYLEEGLEIGQRVGNRAAEMKVLRSLVALHTCLGEYRRAEEYLNLMQDRVNRLHDEPNQGMFNAWLGFWLLQQGRFSEAKAVEESALALAQRQQQQLDIPRVATTSGWIAFYGGDWQQAKVYAAEGVMKSGRFDDSRFTAHALTCRGWAHLRLSQVEEAIPDFQRSAEILLRLEMKNRAQEPLAGLAQAAFQKGDLAAAHAQALPIAHHLLSHPLDRTADTFLAIHIVHAILRAADDPLAEDVRGLGQAHLHYRAANIESEYLDDFWAMPGHEEMMDFRTESPPHTKGASEVLVK
ncbi:MAG: AAA family ATPase [Caldilineaceae bacterium]|nr:AAA family ATPase [Caldilineaceae bacterium]